MVKPQCGVRCAAHTNQAAAGVNKQPSTGDSQTWRSTDRRIMNLPDTQHSAGYCARSLIGLVIAAVACALNAMLPSIALSQSGAFTRVGGLSWNLGSAYGIFISGNYAYALMGQLQIFDISNPPNLV